MDFLIGLVVFIAVAFVLGWVVSSMAKQQREITVQTEPALAVEVIRQHFGSVWWRQVAGPGQLNFRARGLGLGAVLKTKPTLSIDVDQLDASTFSVQVWMSAWAQQAGIVALADRVVLKRAGLFRKLRSLNPVAASSPPRAFAPAVAPQAPAAWPAVANHQVAQQGPPRPQRLPMAHRDRCSPHHSRAFRVTDTRASVPSGLAGHRAGRVEGPLLQVILG